MSSFSRTAAPWFPKGSLFSKFITCRCGRQVPDGTIPENCPHCKIIKANADAYDQLRANMTVTELITKANADAYDQLCASMTVSQTVDTSLDVTNVHVVPTAVDIVPAVVDIVPVVIDIVVNPTNFATIVKCATQGCHETIFTRYQTSSYCYDCERNQPLINMLTAHFGKINQNYMIRVDVSGVVNTCTGHSCLTPEGDPEINDFESTVYLPAFQSALDDFDKIKFTCVTREHYKSQAIKFYLSFLSYHNIDNSLICCGQFVKKPTVDFIFVVPMDKKLKMSRFYDMALRDHSVNLDMVDVSDFLNNADTYTETDTDSDTDDY